MQEQAESLEASLATRGHFYLSNVVMKAQQAQWLSHQLTQAKVQFLLVQLEQANGLDAAIAILLNCYGLQAQDELIVRLRLNECEWQALQSKMASRSALPKTDYGRYANLTVPKSETNSINSLSDTATQSLAHCLTVGFVEEWLAPQPDLSIQAQLEQKLIVQNQSVLSPADNHLTRAGHLPTTSSSFKASPALLTLRKNYFHQQGGALTLQINRAQQCIEINQYIKPTNNTKTVTLAAKQIAELALLKQYLETTQPRLTATSQLIRTLAAQLLTSEQVEKAQDIAASATLLNSRIVTLTGPLESELQAAWIFIEAQINYLDAVANNKPSVRMVGAEHYGFDPYLLNTAARAIYALRQRVEPAVVSSLKSTTPGTNTLHPPK